MKIEVTKEVSKETYEMGIAFGSMVKAIKEALADGWNPGSDLPVVFSAIISNMAEVVQGLQAAQKENSEDSAAFIAACALAVAEVIESLRI